VKAVIYYAFDDIRIENRDIPSISNTELLVKVHGCGLCGSDIIKIVQQAQPPVVLGHELTGTIVERGKAVSYFKASNIDPCGFAEYIRVPTQHVQQTTLLLPESLSAEEGSFVEPLACRVRAVRRTPLLAGDIVVVMGLGSVGLLMLQAVKALGAGDSGKVRVYGVDLLQERLQLARDLGVDDVVLAPADEDGLRQALDQYTEGRGADAIIITAPGTRPFMQALAGVRKGGTVNIFSAHSGIVPIHVENIYQQELSITSTYSSSPEELRIALDLLTSRKVCVDDIISHRLPLTRFSEGVELMRERAALKVYCQISGE